MSPPLCLKDILAFFLLSLATISCCKAQQADAIQIVAQAALCFDDPTISANCLRWMGRISNGSNGISTQNSRNGFCSSPCYGQMMLMLNCMDGIFSNFQFYSPGFMQGVQSVFQMSCGGRANSNNNTSTSGNMVAEPIEDGAEPIMPRSWAYSLLVALMLSF